MKKYLLERFPILWNTQLLWILPLALLGHCFFFGLGFFGLTYSDVTDYYYWGENFEKLLKALNLMVSSLLLIVWVMRLSRHNAFKHFYPIKGRLLLGEFLVFCFITLVCISFYISFLAGEYLKAFLEFPDLYFVSEGWDKYYSKTLPFIVLAYIISLLIFSVRITGMRITLLSVVSGAIVLLLLFISYFLILIRIGSSKGHENIMLVGMYTYILLLVLLVVMLKRLPKRVLGVLLNLIMFFFLPAFLILILYLFSLVMRSLYGEEWQVIVENFFNTYLNFSFNQWTFVIILCVIGFMGLYTKIIRQWKAMPD